MPTVRRLKTTPKGYSYTYHNPIHSPFLKDWFAATSPLDPTLHSMEKRPTRVFHSQYKSSGSKRIGEAFVCLISYQHTILLEMIQCKPQSKGIGRACLQTISNLADKHQITVCLEASPLLAGGVRTFSCSPRSAANRLRKLYEKFGFRVQKSPFPWADKAFPFMVRDPMIAITH